jgi:glucose-1-phosphate thymidylyltransferase
VHESSCVENSIIGPNVAIGENCSISGAILRNTIVDDGSSVTETVLTNSLLGKDCSVSGRPKQLIAADHGAIKIQLDEQPSK